MLAARGVSLGLGGRINLSELNYLPKDKMMLDKMNRLKREQMAEQRAQQARLVVRKHVDSKTLWTACANVIFGIVMISIGLVMTVIGYFDTANSVPSAAQQTQSPDQFADFGLLGYIMKSMQYIGPVFCGIGMFLMIIACVITLESRDRHAQVIQEESAELRRSRRYASQQKKGEITRTETGQMRENGLKVMCTRRNTHSAGDKPMRRRDARQKEVISVAHDEEISAQQQEKPMETDKVQQTARKCHSTANCPIIGPSLRGLTLTTSDMSTTDPMNEYALEEMPKREKADRKMMKSNWDDRREKRGDEANLGGEGATEEADQKRGGKETTPRRKSASAVQTVNRVRPTRGKAPLVRVESVVELSLSSPRSAKEQTKR
ncbi:hypothetical protein niasHT_017061 [Heterodera trifolii]|uniref:Uncharacterized protein n=1 Tax=Heterodera trifolii TaxID=157864 RepID=A0ABD2L000_9BILA